METLKAQKEAIQKNCVGIKTTNECKCRTLKLANICRVKDNGPDEFLECLEENAQDCVFSLSFGQTSYCLSPVNIYIANNKLNKTKPQL